MILPFAEVDRIDRRRVREDLVLRDERRGDILRDHEAAVESAARHEERRKSGEGFVDEVGLASFGDARDLRRRDAEVVHGERERFAVESLMTAWSSGKISGCR